jgi:hypothetical protein
VPGASRRIRIACAVIAVAWQCSGCAVGSEPLPTVNGTRPTTSSTVSIDDTTLASSTSLEDRNDRTRLIVSPDGVQDGTDISVSGVDFAPAIDLVLVQCAGSAAKGSSLIDECDMSERSAARTNEQGDFEASVVVRTVIAVGERTELVCTATTCAIGAGDITDLRLLELAPIPWADDAIVPEAPILQIVELSLDTDDNTGTAIVMGTGFVPGSTVTLVQCPVVQDVTKIDTEDCLYDYGAVTVADQSGRISTEMVAYPRFQRSSGELIDCVVAPATCAIADPWPQDPANRISLVTFE